MLRTLRGRLLTSFLAVILATLFVVAVALYGFATVSTVRLLPVLERLAAISRTNQNELLQLWQSGAGGEELQALLDNTAAQAGVRILVTDADTAEIVFDTATGDDWVGDQLTQVSRPVGPILPNVARGSIFGTFRHPNGSQWVVFAEPNRALGRALIFYAQPEPTPRAFFNDFFLRPLMFAGALAFLLAILLAVLITRSVAGPLRELTGAAEGIARGNYDQRVEVEGPLEVRSVAGSFNTMAAQVKSTQAAQRDFLANVSHDLKTPLTAVSGWSQALLDGAADTPAERRQAAETIHFEAERMSRMVNDLLDLARIESGQIQLERRPVDLGEIMADVHRSQLPRARDKSIDLVLETQPAPTVLGDPDRLVQIFTNLVDNALNHTPAGGIVRLGVRPANGMVEGVVTDTGPGIADEELPRVFERFYRVEKSRARRDDTSGAGLGLAIVQQLVAAHGGQVLASSEINRGTTMVVRLPTAPDSDGLLSHTRPA